MGSPLSLVVVNLYMEALEQQALAKFPCKPRLWLRYMDDAFAVWPQWDNRLSAFHAYLNSQHPSIQFTIEEESDNTIAFWDLWWRDGALLSSLLCSERRHTPNTNSTLNLTTSPE